VTLLLLFLGYALALSLALGLAGHRESKVSPASSSPVRPRRILIVGATGGTGRELVAQALERGYEVTALVRSPARLQMNHSRLRVLAGNVLDEAAVDAAMRGQEAVVCALGHKRFFHPTRILSRGTRNILRAMEAHGAARLVCETALGIGGSAGRMGLYYTLFTIPVILPFYFWDKTRQEREIATSNVEWVIVRPGALNNAPRRGRWHEGKRVGNLFWTVRIARADVADFMLNQLENDNWLRAAPGLAW
jgi:putative NADH-flavin reductase